MRVVVAEDLFLLRDGLVRLVEAHGHEVVAAVESGPATLFDEPYAGLDATARRLFYDRLLSDYSEHPRTVLLSTHLIDKVADLLERVLVIDRGRITLDAQADELRGSATAVSGPAPAVAEFVAERTTWERRTVGSLAIAVVADMLDATDQAWAHQLHLNAAPLSLQEIVVHTTHRIGSNQRDGALS